MSGIVSHRRLVVAHDTTRADLGAVPVDAYVYDDGSVRVRCARCGTQVPDCPGLSAAEKTLGLAVALPA